MIYGPITNRPQIINLPHINELCFRFADYSGTAPEGNY